MISNDADGCVEKSPGAFVPTTDPMAPAAATKTNAPTYSAALGRSTRALEMPSSSLWLPKGVWQQKDRKSARFKENFA